jgi:hypothetical protein
VALSTCGAVAPPEVVAGLPRRLAGELGSGSRGLQGYCWG